jgi:hypothetical protein
VIRAMLAAEAKKRNSAPQDARTAQHTIPDASPGTNPQAMRPSQMSNMNISAERMAQMPFDVHARIWYAFPLQEPAGSNPTAESAGRWRSKNHAQPSFAWPDRRGRLSPPDSLRYKIFFPNADNANSTAKSAVRLCSSMTGLTSTISKLSMRPWSAMISMARWASR